MHNLVYPVILCASLRTAVHVCAFVSQCPQAGLRTAVHVCSTHTAACVYLFLRAVPSSLLVHKLQLRTLAAAHWHVCAFVRYDSDGFWLL